MNNDTKREPVEGHDNKNTKRPRTIAAWCAAAVLVMVMIVSPGTIMTSRSQKKMMKSSKIENRGKNLSRRLTQMPSVAWLMSFPNSGTTYTERLVEKVTQSTVATNYGHEHVNSDGQPVHIVESIPVFEGGRNGPFRLSEKPLPDGGYILTKTHCGGYCFSDCPPHWFILDPSQYLEECIRGARFESRDEGKNTERFWVQYDPSISRKVVHLFRDPFDNIVSRFHHEYKTHSNQHDMEWSRKYPNNAEGFKSWCTDSDNRFMNEEPVFFDVPTLEAFKGVSCHGEFFRYVQWHNNAFAVADDLDIPTHVLHYKDYQDQFDQTLEELLTFLERKKIDDPPPFSMKSYNDYYTNEERSNISTFIKFLAGPKTWEQLNSKYNIQNFIVQPGFMEDVRLRKRGLAASDVDNGLVAAPALPNVSWLMSFPNSGTTFTEHLVQRVTDRAVATFYGHEFVNDKGFTIHNTQSIPVYDGKLDGPFRLSNKSLPDGGYILTKTHCGGYCFSDCPPNWYNLTPDKFLNECTTGARFEIDDRGVSNRIWVHYDPKIIKKAVHLFRNPFDNVVSRFHHEYKLTHRNSDHIKWLKNYPNNKEGFRSWCKDTDARYVAEKRNQFQGEFWDLMKTVPCHGEFFRYVSWHNNAFQVAENLDIPVHVVHYVDYHDNMQETVIKLLKFLEQPMLQEDFPLFAILTYDDYYSKEDRSRISTFIKSLASPKTWDNLKRYNIQGHIMKTLE